MGCDSLTISLAPGGEALSLLDCVGSGATSEVWRGRLAVNGGEPGALVAVKIAKGPQETALLAAEAEQLLWTCKVGSVEMLASGRVVSSAKPSVVPLDRGCLVLSWAGLRNLGDFTIPNDEKGDCALRLAHDLGAALSDLHQAGYAHGDIKPSNIVIADDDNSATRFGLVDLGLSAPADQTMPRGATPHYLAPEALLCGSRGDGRTRDLWALGVVLAEVALGQTADGRSLRDLSRHKLDEPLRSIIERCLAPHPGGRAPARWIAQRAAEALRAIEDPISTQSRRVVQLRRAYINVRRTELIRCARCRTPELQIEGAAAEWVGLAIAGIRGWLTVRGDLNYEKEPITLRESTPFHRRRILTHVVGPIAANWHISATQSEGDWLAQWLSRTKTADPANWTLSQAETELKAHPSKHVTPDITDLSLALASGRATQVDIDCSESLVLRAQGPTNFALALAERLRARGEMGRALGVLLRCPGALARAEAAETARRSGDVELAKQLLAAITEPVDWATRARLCATGARLALAENLVDFADRHVKDAPLAPATCECRALVELARGDRVAAREAIDIGRSLSATEEEQARLLGLLGMLEQEDGEAEKSAIAFRQAVDIAARTGALLEEATYLTGLSHALVSVGALSEAMTMAERSIALFEALGRPSHAARAALNLLVCYSELGQVDEARATFEFSATLARQSQDPRCLGYLHLAMADVLSASPTDSIQHLERAEHWLSGLSNEDVIQVAAKRWELHLLTDPLPTDEASRRSQIGVEARLTWWGARARRAAADRELNEAATVLAELASLASIPAPALSLARALAAGLQLALLASAGDIARRFTFGLSDIARQVLKNCASELRPAIEALPWMALIRVPREQLFSSEQIAEIERMLRSLSHRDDLRGLLTQVVDVLVLWTGVERGLLLLRAPGGKLQPRVARNLRKSDLQGEQLALSHSLAEQCILAGEPIVAVDATRELASVHASVHALKLRSVLAVPLISGHQTLGVVYLDDRARQGAFGERELAWVRLVSTVAAAAIADARDRLALRRAIRRAERGQRLTTDALAAREAELGQARVELAETRGTRATRFRYDGIIGESVPMRNLLALVDRVIQSDVPVMIVGESGTGKELIAKAIHRNGHQAGASFVAENCAAIPESLLESALFGHTRGAFTGAVRARTGLFDVAHGGTLFLDEIAEMSLAMQSKLLRVLQDGSIRPVGSDRSHQVQVRIIGATHRNLEELVQTGAFRQDLYYRLNVVKLTVPPLRDRTSDIPLLIEHFLRFHCGNRNMRISDQAQALLCGYSWPGNIRQLDNEVRRALVLSEGLILPEHLSDAIRLPAAGTAFNRASLNMKSRVSALEHDLITEALRTTDGNLTRSAELLGISRFGLQKMLRRLDVDRTQGQTIPIDRRRQTTADHTD